MRHILSIVTIMLVSTPVLALQEYETGVILLKVKLPNVVRFIDGRVQNGSNVLQNVLQQYPPLSSRKLLHVNSATDGWYRLEFHVNISLENIRQELLNCPDIHKATLNYSGIYSEIPNDSHWSHQWALDKIETPMAWALTKGNNTVLVGVLDSGLDYNHEDLSDNVWTNPNEIPGNGIDDDGNNYIDDIRGWDFRDSDSEPQEEGGSSHGTRVAGVIAARTNNNIGVAGIAGGWGNQAGASLIALRIGDNTQWYQQFAAEALNYLTALRQQHGYTIIVNMSFQTVGIADEPQPLLADAVNAAHNAGVIMVAAAGNMVNNPHSPYNQAQVPSLPIPARYSGVLAIGASEDGAALQDEVRSSYSLFDIETSKLLVVAPVDDHAGSAINIYTTYPGDSYVNWFNGTSAACPIAVGVVSLILSINPSLSYSDIADILAMTAEKIGNYSYGPSGRTNEVGYGRINAYQALLLAHAYQNKSVSAEATAKNNGRRVVRDNTGKYHVVFESGITSGGEVLSEIFYRNSTDGTTWSAPIRLSTGNEKNRYPSITQFNNKLYAVWQRKVDSSSHDITFATSQNGGASWNEPYVLASTSLASDPLPVIQTGVASNFAMMVIYRSGGASAKLKSLRTTSSNPTSAGPWTNADVPATGANDLWPALASTRNYWGSDANFGVAYANTGGHIHYRYYQHASGGWSANQVNLSAIVPGSNDAHQTPTLTGVGDGSSSYNLHVAWHRITGSGGSQYDHAIIHRKSNGFDSWPSQYYLVYYQGQRRPSLTALSSSKVDLVFQYYNQNYIYKMRFNGSSWSTPTYAANGSYPSVSTGASLAKYVYTGSNIAPYTINLSSETLQKSGGMKDPAYSRSVAWLDSSGAFLEIIVDAITLKLKDGTTQQADFAIASLDSFELTTANAWELFASEPLAIPADAESLFVDYSVVAEKMEIVAQPVPGNRHLSLQIADASKNTLATRVGASLPTDGDLAKAMYRHGFGADVLRNVSQASIELKVSGLAAKSAAFASLGHVFDFNKTIAKANESIKNSADKDRIPTSIVLASHPNPFNPETEIRLQSPVSGNVTLAIYDILGKRIKTIFAGKIDNTVRRLRWDAKDDTGQPVTTGLYFAVLTGQLDNGQSVKISQKLMLIR